MRRNRLRELLDGDQPSLGTHLHISWPSIVELVGHSGMFGYVEFVGEYAPCTPHGEGASDRAA